MSNVNEENIKFSFLLTASYNALPASCFKLRSYFNSLSANIADIHGIKLPKCLKNKNVVCLHCYSPWNCDTSSFKLISAKKAKRSEKFQETSDGNNVTKNYGQLRNKMVLKCKVCCKETNFYLVRQSKIVKPVVVKKELEIKNQKKKKKKDIFCGLKVRLSNSKNDEDDDSQDSTTNNKKSSLETSSKESDIVQTTDYIPLEPISRGSGFHNNQNGSETSRRAKRLVINPFSETFQNRIKSKKKKLKQLKKAAKQGNPIVRNSLKNFLNLVK